MTFREALQRHLEAIRERDLHRGWFASPGWTLDTQDQNTPIKT